MKTVSNLKNLPPGLIKRDEAYLNSAWKTITNAAFQNRFKKGLMGLDFRRQEGKKISICIHLIVTESLVRHFAMNQKVYP